jgi:hypothetical protein
MLYAKPDLSRALGRNRPSEFCDESYDTIRIQEGDIITEILNVKLKPTPKQEKITLWEPRHPVLRELLATVKRV